ncbi:MAG: CoA transferase, partial [Rhodobacteraceae bacterium]|nr:CoA transferase [Paracoccaceae bacterium]
EKVATRPVDDWLAVLEPADIWCARVLDWPALLASEGFQVLDMLQTVTRADGVSIETTRLPLRLNGHRPVNTAAAPLIGAHSAAIRKEFNL